MGWNFEDWQDYETFNFEQMWEQIEKDPERMFLGAGDTVGTEIWNKVLNKDWEPIVNEYGGAAYHRDEDAEANGIDTETGRGMHDIAEVIASYFAGGYFSEVGSGAGQAFNVGTEVSEGNKNDKLGRKSSGSSGASSGSGGSPFGSFGAGSSSKPSTSGNYSALLNRVLSNSGSNQIDPFKEITAPDGTMY